ncbi:MAG: glycosyltransferase family 2 protein [Marinicella sp.]|nr:glycosyltransferase family 2 protein [Xanthomonadales bacterium]
MNNRFCIIIPIYNHHHKLNELLHDLSCYELPVFLIDDGSEENSRVKINTISKQYPLVELHTLPENQGKGGAVMAGLRLAFQGGFSHGIQIDADYQHDLKDIPEFMGLSSQSPKALICGVPQYDHTVNKGRYYARYLTHVWVWINTLSFDIKDSMCGFRSYPLDLTVALINRVKLGQRMNFDTEILVRLHWQQVQIINLPTKVVYHHDVPSNFKAFKDNVGISWMHTKLFFGMLLRLPVLLFRKIK